MAHTTSELQVITKAKSKTRFRHRLRKLTVMYAAFQVEWTKIREILQSFRNHMSYVVLCQDLDQVKMRNFSNA